ncbi:MAG TPA: DUF456 domain-containing protein [Bacteroidia bacterium]|nr:DUF456 domain-containing protein [Bacteroidia bacterium]HRS59189.1 DUF456 domain-containing protein [Bacteroidia bacterium]HRU67237.1 DUF456 domain-containing protein [Bacteroidia bacterium]
MDTVLIVLGAIVLAVGIAGCILPVLPGPWLSYISLILLQFTSSHPYSVRFLIIAGVMVAIVTVLDYLVPVWGTKKFGGSKAGVRGSTIGLFAGLFLGPFGIILCPFLGAVAGELIAGKNSKEALRSGFGSFVGFLAGVVMKLGVSAFIAFHFIKALI